MLGIIERWEDMLNLLDRQLHGKVRVPDEIIDQTRLRIRRFAQDVDQSVIPLTPPNRRIIGDETFKGLRIGPPLSSDDTDPEALAEAQETIRRVVPQHFDTLKLPPITDITEMARVRTDLVRLKANAYVKYQEYSKALMSVNAKYGRMLTAHMTGKRVQVREHGKRITKYFKQGPCWCGCGALAGIKYDGSRRPVGINRFIKGHIKRYDKTVIAVETGRMRKDDLGDIMRDGLPWTTCDLCGGHIPAVDPYGRPLQEKVGLACWRSERGITNPYKEILFSEVVDANLQLDVDDGRK